MAITSVTYLKKKDAAEEMKNKGMTTDPTLTDCLPAIPGAVRAQVDRLVLKKFRER